MAKKGEKKIHPWTRLPCSNCDEVVGATRTESRMINEYEFLCDSCESYEQGCKENKEQFKKQINELETQNNKLNLKIKQINNMLTPFQRCQVFHDQDCLNCEDINCGDNQNEVLKKQKNEEIDKNNKLVNEIEKLKEKQDIDLLQISTLKDANRAKTVEIEQKNRTLDDLKNKLQIEIDHRDVTKIKTNDYIDKLNNEIKVLEKDYIDTEKINNEMYQEIEKLKKTIEQKDEIIKTKNKDIELLFELANDRGKKLKNYEKTQKTQTNEEIDKNNEKDRIEELKRLLKEATQENNRVTNDLYRQMRLSKTQKTNMETLIEQKNKKIREFIQINDNQNKESTRQKDRIEELKKKLSNSYKVNNELNRTKNKQADKNIKQTVIQLINEETNRKNQLLTKKQEKIIKMKEHVQNKHEFSKQIKRQIEKLNRQVLNQSIQKQIRQQKFETFKRLLNELTIK